MTTFETLLSEFKKLPVTKRETTLLQVAGYPHYENVCSNILAFYLDPLEEHGLGDMLLQVFLKLHSPEKDTIESITEANVHREWSTDKSQRIDLVVEFPGGILSIENKVYHHLDNDLAHYADDVSKLYDKDMNSEEKAPKFYNCLLSPKPYTQNLPGDFKSITYHQVWDAVEAELGAKLHQASPKWVTFLTDFIQTTRNFSNTSTMEFNDTERFLINNKLDVDKLIKAQSGLDRRFKEIVSNLSSRINDSHTENAPSKITEHLVNNKTWIHAKRCLVFDFKLPEEYRIAIDLWLSSDGWTFQLFARDNRSREFLNNHMRSHTALIKLMKGNKIENQRYVINQWLALEELNLNELHNTLEKWVIPIAEYIKETTLVN